MARLLMPIARQASMRMFSELEAAVVKALAFQGASPLTVKQYAVCYGQFLSYITEGRGLTDDVRHFTPEHVQGFAERMMTRGAGPNTLRNKLSALATMAKLGMILRDDKGRPWLTQDPTRTFPWPKLQRRETKYLYAHELAALWKAPCSPALAIARELLIDTGARVSSLVNAKVGHVREIGGGAYLLLTVKGGRQEVVPLSTPAAKRLHDYLVRRELTDKDDDLPLLVRDDGKAWTRTALSEAIVRLAKAAGVTRFRVSAHKIRHTNNVFARGAGLDEFTRAKLLTHSSTATLKVYDHEIPGELAKAREIQRQHLEAETGRVMEIGYGAPTDPLDDLQELRGFV